MQIWKDVEYRHLCYEELPVTIVEYKRWPELLGGRNEKVCVDGHAAFAVHQQ